MGMWWKDLRKFQKEQVTVSQTKQISFLPHVNSWISPTAHLPPLNLQETCGPLKVILFFPYFEGENFSCRWIGSNLAYVQDPVFVSDSLIWCSSQVKDITSCIQWRTFQLQLMILYVNYISSNNNNKEIDGENLLELFRSLSGKSQPAEWGSQNDLGLQCHHYSSSWLCSLGQAPSPALHGCPSWPPSPPLMAFRQWYLWAYTQIASNPEKVLSSNPG